MSIAAFVIQFIGSLIASAFVLALQQIGAAVANARGNG
jgi:hypothetical protein